MSPGDGRWYVARSFPELPPSSATVAMAVSRVWSRSGSHGKESKRPARRPRSTVGSPVPPPRATTRRSERASAGTFRRDASWTVVTIEGAAMA